MKILARTILPMTWITIGLSLLSLSAFGQKSEEGWKGILPLKTDRATVNRLLGIPEIDDNGYYRYVTNEAFVEVNFASAPCAADPKNPGINRGKYTVSEGTVLDYYVIPRNTLTLSELKLDLKRFYRDTSGDVGNVAHYWEYIDGTRKTSNQNGVSIAVSIQQGVEYVATITYYPREAEKALVKCKDF